MTDKPQVDARITNGLANAHEVAAITAVMSVALYEESHAQEAVPPRTQNGWQRSQRGHRTPIAPGAGVWGQPC